MRKKLLFQIEKLAATHKWLESNLDLLKPQIENSQRDEKHLRTQTKETYQEHKGFQETLGNMINLTSQRDKTKRKLEEHAAEASKDLLAEKQASKKRLREFLSNSIDALETAGEYHEKYMKDIGKLAGVKMTDDRQTAKIEELTYVFSMSLILFCSLILFISYYLLVRK